MYILIRNHFILSYQFCSSSSTILLIIAPYETLSNMLYLEWNAGSTDPRMERINPLFGKAQVVQIPGPSAVGKGLRSFLWSSFGELMKHHLDLKWSQNLIDDEIWPCSSSSIASMDFGGRYICLKPMQCCHTSLWLFTAAIRRTSKRFWRGEVFKKYIKDNKNGHHATWPCTACFLGG